jgi:branched-chain amino acid transport system substrate-binding protein
MGPADSSNKLWRRSDVIKLLGATAITGPMILQGTTANAATSKVIKIGYVSSQTGVLAPVTEADPFILEQIRTPVGERDY